MAMQVHGTGEPQERAAYDSFGENRYSIAPNRDSELNCLVGRGGQLVCVRDQGRRCLSVQRDG